MTQPTLTRWPKIPFLRLAGTLISAALLFYLLYEQGWDKIWAAVSHISLGRLALVFGLMIISRLAVSARWHVLLRSGGVPIPLAQSLRITFAGLFANNVLPTTIGGDVVRLGGVMRLGYDRAVCVASLVVDRLVGMTGMAMMLPFGLPAFLNPTSSAAAPLSAVAVPVGGWAGRLWERGLHIARRLLQALALWASHPKDLLFALVFTWVHMLCLFSIFWLLLDDMGQSVPFLLIGGLESVSYFITLLPISINGLGVQEVSIAALFAVYGGASQESGLTLAILYRTIMMIVSLPGALFIPGMMAGAPSADATASPDELEKPA